MDHIQEASAFNIPQPASMHNDPYAPLPSQESKIVIPKKEKSPKGCLKFLLLILVALFGIFTVTVIIGYIFLMPRLRLGKAVRNTIFKEPVQVNVVSTNIDASVKDFRVEYLNGGASTNKTIFQVTSVDSLGEMAIASRTSVITKDSVYSKIDHNQKDRLLTQLLTDYPEFNSSKAVEILKPVLFGDYWMKDKILTTTTQQAPPKMLVDLAFSFMTFPFELASISKTSDLYTYVLTPRENMTWEFTHSISTEDFQTDENLISEEDIKMLLKTLKETQNISDTKITFEFTRGKESLLKSVKIELPKLAGEVTELNLDQHFAEKKTLFSYILQSIINKTNSGNSALTELFSAQIEYPTELKIEIPTKYTDISTLDEETIQLYAILSGFLMTSTELSNKANSPENLFVTKSHETKLLFDQGDYFAMLKSSEELLALSSTEDQKAIAHYWLGLAHFNLNHDKEAEDALLVAVDIKDDYAAPYVPLASLSFKKQDADSGLEYSLKCAEIDPSYAWCYNNIGIAYMYKNKPEAGISYLEKAVSLDPTSFVFADNLKRAKASSGL